MRRDWPRPEIGEDQDVFRGGPGKDILATYYGDDRFYGGPDNDRFDLINRVGLGNSVVHGQEGNDSFHFPNWSSNADSCSIQEATIRIFGHQGNDRVVVDSLYRSRTCAGLIIKGGTGEHDWLRFWKGYGPTMTDLERGFAKVRLWAWPDRFLLVSIEDATGGKGNDIIIGTEASNILDGGGAGKDEIHGKGGDDTVSGAWKKDRLYGGDGDDLLLGKAQNDFLDGGDGWDNLDGGYGSDTCVNGETYVSCELPLWPPSRCRPATRSILPVTSLIVRAGCGGRPKRLAATSRPNPRRRPDKARVAERTCPIDGVPTAICGPWPDRLQAISGRGLSY